LPAPLPTKEEIQASSNIIKGKESWDTRRVVIVGQHFLVKYGQRARQVEGENLVFIEQNLHIQAPLLYAMWREPDGELYIIDLFAVNHRTEISSQNPPSDKIFW
jgi:hypothetical protein